MAVESDFHSQQPLRATAVNQHPTDSIRELSPLSRKAALLGFWPVERLFRPICFGLEHIPKERPLMFVGNHQFLSFDTPFLITALWRQGIFVRALGDDFLFATPGLAQGLEAYGVVKASPEAATTLLRRGESLLVYPGGAREASKNAGHEDLDWWDRLGFAHLALRERCTVVPVAATGVDNRIRILLAPERYLDSPLGSLVDKLHLRRDMFLPVFLPTQVPRPAFQFCPPIRVQQFRNRDPETSARSLRSETAKAIADGLRDLHQALGTRTEGRLRPR